MAGLLPGPDQVFAQTPGAYGPPIGAILAEYLDGRASASILYFPPGRYVLEGPAGHEYVVPQGMQLFFADGAILRIVDGVTLVIRGTIRAGKQQIFGFSRDETTLNDQVGRPAYTVPAGVITWPLYSNAGTVVIESDTMPLVRPEWWGAVPVDARDRVQSVPNIRGYDSSDAFQGAIEAACTQRRGRSPLPISVGGVYVFVRTVEVRPARLGFLSPVCLVLRGTFGVSEEGLTLREDDTIWRWGRGNPTPGPTQSSLTQVPWETVETAP